VNRKRLGEAFESVHWLVADITQVELAPSAYDVWHDRAVFHFLTLPSDRVAYVRQVAHAVKPGGDVIVSTFGPDGPTKCSGLDVVRYDAESLHREFGVRFRLLKSCAPQKVDRSHAAISSSRYSWCSPPRTSCVLIRPLAGNSCRWMLGRSRSLLAESGSPGPKLAWGRP
jgi:hypothetical protein